MSKVNFVAIDLETATYDRSSICEIGIAIVENGKVTGSKSWLVRPVANVYDDFNIEIHGITPDMTENAPSFKEVWTEVEPYLTGKNVVAHNTGFDMYAIKDALEYSNMTLPVFNYYCSLRIARNAYPGLYTYSLQPLCEEVGIPMNSHHRAEVDAIACAELMLKSIDKLGFERLEDIAGSLHYQIGCFNGIEHTPMRYKGNYVNILKSITADESQFDEGNYFYDKSVCFTGTMISGLRKDMLQAIANIGGKPVDSVTKTTNVLVVGQQDYRVVGEEGMSSKQKKAMKLVDSGCDIEIMSEAEFVMNFGVEIKSTRVA